ncbi:hypothetical protein SAMN05660226_02474 [Parapedobacter luteus]|uniref:Uncharacterized protein n=1 Tax=Parapedobacter luteus TaxID=623280 RepID=A0A1T5CYB3_9SPHI|nr:hypothetical protein SAMN05660226_02474 [Parapedobacter luteus]
MRNWSAIIFVNINTCRGRNVIHCPAGRLSNVIYNATSLKIFCLRLITESLVFYRLRSLTPIFRY